MNGAMFAVMRKVFVVSKLTGRYDVTHNTIVLNDMGGKGIIATWGVVSISFFPNRIFYSKINTPTAKITLDFRRLR